MVAGLEELADVGRTLVMGVVNVTPDSFSDGGEWFEPDAAIAHGRELLGEGADVLDVGGESTRPGAGRVPVEAELARVLPVISALAAEGAVVSVDTTRAVVAERAVAAGARIVNDVSGGLADPAMAEVVARTGVAYVCMHWRGHADVMDDLEDYDDVVTDVRDELAARVDALLAAGVRREQVVLDPGLGFSKAGSSNWPLLARLRELEALGLPVLVGASRKRFLGTSSRAPTGGPSRRSCATTRPPRSRPSPRRRARGACGCTPSGRPPTPCGSPPPGAGPRRGRAPRGRDGGGARGRTEGRERLDGAAHDLAGWARAPRRGRPGAARHTQRDTVTTTRPGGRRRSTGRSTT